MADFGFGDVALSLFGGGGDSGPAFGSDLNFGVSPLSRDIQLPSIETGGGASFGGELPTLPKEKEPSAFDKIAGSAKDLGGVAKAALPIVQLGGAGLGIGLGIKGAQQGAEQTKIAKQAEKRQGQIAEKAEAAAAPLSAFSQQQLTQAGAGKIDPAQEAMIQQWVQGAKQKVQDLFARTGQGDSLQLQNELAWIDQMAQGMRMQAITSEEQVGLTAASTAGGLLGTGASAAGGAGSAAQSSGSNIAALIKQANEALGTLAGSSA